MNIWDESPPPEPNDGSTPDPSDGDPGATAAAGGGTGGNGTEPPEPPEEPEEPDHGWWSQRIAGIPAWLLLSLGVVLWIAVIAALVLPGSDDDPETVEIAVPAATSAATDPTLAATTTNTATTLPTISNASTTMPASTTPTTTTAAPATTTTTTTTTTLPAATTTTTTTATTTTTTVPAATTTTTVPATTTTTTTAPPAVLEATTVVGDAGQSITAFPYEGPCSSGPDCLVVGFTIDGWATHPMGWVCEFSSGARYAFKFEKDGADPACSTVDVPDSIIIDIDGLRTNPITIG